eukprot:COSAG05_NODE_28_length_29121_cov_56.951933_20_plen_80_part_00
MLLSSRRVMNAGDVLFFIDGGLTHGATAWKNPLPRRGILMKYSGREVHRSGGDLGTPTAANPASNISGVFVSRAAAGSG